MFEHERHSGTVRSIVVLLTITALAGAATGVVDADSGANETVTARIDTHPQNASEIDFARNDIVVLDAFDSTETDDTIEEYEWDVDGDGTFERTGALTAVRLDYCGERTVTLRVTNNDSGETATAEVTLSTA